MSQGSFSSSLFHAENWCVNQSRRGDESYQSLPAALQCENPNFSRNANLSRGHQPPQQLSVFQNQNSDWYGLVQDPNGFLVAASSPIYLENRQSRLAREDADQNQMVQQGGIYLAYPSRGQPGQIQGGIRNQTVVDPNNPLVRQNRAPTRGAHVQQNLNFGVQEQGEFGANRVLPRGTSAQQTMNFGVVEAQCGVGETRTARAQGSFYGYMESAESSVSMQFNPGVQQQLQPQAFALPQPIQECYVPYQWPYQETAQVAQMELEAEMQKVKLSGQYAKVLKELPILNGTEGREAISDFFTALETRTTEWSSEKIVEVLQIKVKGKAREEMAAVVTRFGNTISLKVFQSEIIKAIYGEESLEKGLQQDRRAEPIRHHRSSAGEEHGVGVEVECQNHQFLEAMPPREHFLVNLLNGSFGQPIESPKQLPLKISLTTEETVQFVNLERLKARSGNPISLFFSEDPVTGTRMLQPSCCLESPIGNLQGDQQPQLNRKVSAKSKKEVVPPNRADEERIKTLEKQLELVSKERDKLKTLVESFIGGKETNRKSRKVLAHKLRKIFPVEKTEKTFTTGKSELAGKTAHSSTPKIVQKTPEILVPPPTRGRIPFPNSVKFPQKEPAEKFDRSKAGETGRRKEFVLVFVNSALKKAQSAPNSLKTHPKQKKPTAHHYTTTKLSCFKALIVMEKHRIVQLST